MGLIRAVYRKWNCREGLQKLPIDSSHKTSESESFGKSGESASFEKEYNREINKSDRLKSLKQPDSKESDSDVKSLKIVKSTKKQLKFDGINGKFLCRFMGFCG
jgi:hypothetical protein